MALFDRWMVVVCGTKLVEELHRMPDEDASFLDGTGEVCVMMMLYRGSWNLRLNGSFILRCLRQSICSATAYLGTHITDKLSASS